MITSQAPGRVCLFGEHHDYLGLPVIAAPINRYITVKGTKIFKNHYKINCPDIDQTFVITADDLNKYDNSKDFFKSSINVFKKEYDIYPPYFEATITGNIPINSGTSSSSALLIAFINFLFKISNVPNNDSEKIAQLGYNAEVTEFKLPGGMMDHYSSAIGGVIYLKTELPFEYKKMKYWDGQFLLVDSKQPKDTYGIIGDLKSNIIAGIKYLSNNIKDFNIHTTDLELILDTIELSDLSTRIKVNVIGTFKNRDITKKAIELFNQEPLNKIKLSNLLYQQHKYLSEYLNTSTPQIDDFIDKSIELGAYGGKINGSGGGGCMFLYVPENNKKIIEYIEQNGGIVHKISIDKNGVK